jgi:hypothetical protein
MEVFVPLIEIKRLFPVLDIKKTNIDVRVVIITLNTGEKELLITSLLDQKEYSKEIFESLYFKRWSIEENYKWHKQALELENFSGQSKLAIKQDFFSLVFTANIASLLMSEAQEEVLEDHRYKDLKHVYKINKRLAIASLRDELVKNLLDRHANIDKFCERLKIKFKKDLCPIRPNRSYKRTLKGRLKFRSTYRKCI